MSVLGVKFPAPDTEIATKVFAEQIAILYRLLPATLGISVVGAALAGVPIVQAWAGLLNVTPDEAPIIGPVAGLKTSVFLEVEGAAHYLPAYAGNLDIMTSAALATAERWVETKLKKAA